MFTLLLAAAMAVAADAPLENTGAPMRVGFVCADDELREAGLSCSEDEPCRVYLELSGVESSAGRVFLSGNLHTTSTTLASILLVAEDGGRTWREAWQRMPYTALDEIQFVDFEHGWIAGQNVQTVARDPFLLTTGDGGRTWRAQALFEEGQPGAIQRFWFESAKAGVVLVDRGLGKRYELYRTMTGGASWELVQASRDPVHFPGGRAKEAAPAWRLRADARTASWQIEQNRDEAWQRVAAFSTEVALCR
ncbi:MAG: hypothetical protein ABSF98_16155 [Bryobacteraceae bacterium]|jgi:hypothetical protein